MFIAGAAVVLSLAGGWPAASEEISVFATGTASKKDDVVSITITGGRQQNGAGLVEMKNKSLKVVGNNVMAVEKLIGKDIEVRGTIKEGAEIDVAWVGEKKVRDSSSKSERKVRDSSSEKEIRPESQTGGAVGQPLGAINGSGPGSVPSASGARGAVGAVNSREKTDARGERATARRPAKSTRRR